MINSDAMNFPVRNLAVFVLFPVAFLIYSCSSEYTLTDPGATKETRALFANLKKLSENHTLFAHQHATEYGHGWTGDKDRSDVKSVCGPHPAFTETGLESIPDTTWWTETLLKTMQMHDMDLAYVLVWRNDTRSPTHYYAPFPGQVSVPGFMKFYDDEYSLFEGDLEKIYLE